MKRLLWTALLVALPVMSFATSVDIANQGGTLSGSSSGLTLTGSTMITIGVTGTTPIVGDLGSVTFSTAALVSGTLAGGGTFGAGGSFLITGNGTGGIPNGVIFNGQFVGPVSWDLITLSNGTHAYKLTGAIEGTWFNGKTTDGAVVALTVNVGNGFFKGSAGFSSGDINVNASGIKSVTTPEPASLTLLGTGLVSLGAAYKRRRKRV